MQETENKDIVDAIRSATTTITAALLANASLKQGAFDLVQLDTAAYAGHWTVFAKAAQHLTMAAWNNSQEIHAYQLFDNNPLGTRKIAERFKEAGWRGLTSKESAANLIADVILALESHAEDMARLRDKTTNMEVAIERIQNIVDLVRSRQKANEPIHVARLLLEAARQGIMEDRLRTQISNRLPIRLPELDTESLRLSAKNLSAEITANSITLPLQSKINELNAENDRLRAELQKLKFEKTN